MIECILFWKRIWDRSVQDEVTVYAAYASLFILIAFFPFLMVLLALIQFIPSVTKSDLLSLLVRLMPDMLDSLVVGVVDDLYVKSPATILSVSGILALWSASRGMMGIERGLQRIYRITAKQNYIIRRLASTLYTFIFTIACVVSLILLVFGTTLQNLLIRILPVVGAITRHVISVRALLAIVLFLFTFVCLYKYLPGKSAQRPLSRQIPGAMFATAGWILSSYVFSLYFTNFSNFSYMYGSLTAIVLMMLWLYMSICIFFIGAEVNQLLEFYEETENQESQANS